MIESFQSRVHIIKIEHPNEKQLLEMYNDIIKKEKLTVTDDAKEFILKYCKKSFRSLLNQMEKIFIISREIDIEIALKLCSEINFRSFEMYINFIQNNDLNNAIKTMYDIAALGYSVVDIYDYLFTFIKSTNLITEEKKYLLIPLFCNYITIFHSVHEDSIELALFTNRVYEILKN